MAASLLAVLAIGAPSAFGAYVEIGSFAGGGPGPGGSGSGDGQLANPGQADVNDSSGKLYVADTGNERVEVFAPTPTGAQYDSQVAVAAPTGLAIDQTDGSVYVATATGIEKYDEGLSPVGAGWTDPGVTGALAVDPSTGDLLVADLGANLVRRFESDGTAAGSFSAERPIDLAADSSGDVLVVTSTGDVTFDCGATSTVRRFSAAGLEEGTVGGSLSAPGAVAVDPDDDSFVIASPVNQYSCGAALPAVSFFDPDGVELEKHELPADTQFAMVPGLVAQGGGSTRVYALTKSPANDVWGATEAIAFEVPPPAPPEVVSASSLRGTRSATLRAAIDPKGAETSYHFEYGATTAYGQVTPQQVLSAGFGKQAVSVRISGLEPGTTYHFRAIASNSLGDTTGPDRVFMTMPATTCPNDEFRKGPAADLSDCRAYELVTPPGSDADIRIGGGPASLSGDTVCFGTEDQLAGSAPNGIKTAEDGFCAWRRAGGWETKWVTGPTPERRVPSMGSNVYFLSPDGQRAVFASDAVLFGHDYVPPPGSPNGPPVSAYMWEDGVTSWLAPGALVGDPPAYGLEGVSRPESQNEKGAGNARRPIAVSEDLTHGVFESDLPLVPSDENGMVDLYEWYPGGLRVVSRDSSGKAAGGRAAIQATLQSLAPPGTVSADGSRIFFEHDGAPLAGNATEAPEGHDPEDVHPDSRIQSVYMREGNDITLVSPRRGSGPDASVWFAGASADGNLAYLETTQQLTPESKEPGRAIYSYDVPSDELELVADAPGGVSLLTSSADGSTIVYREVASNELIVKRNGVETPLGVLAGSDHERPNRVASERIDERALRITPDGRAVVFAAAGEFAGSGPGLIKIYRWEAGNGIELISAEAGAEPSANASIGAYPALIGDPREEVFLSHRVRANVGRVMSEDGSRVVFETPEALVERDVNGVTDVYEWHDGQIDLVSSGTGGKALYHESSADGRTVFFTTFDRLDPTRDRNSKRDLYVARPGGGLPPPPSPPDCDGEGCQQGRTAPAASDPKSASTGAEFGHARRAAVPTASAAKQLKRLGRKGAVTLKVTVTTPGRVTARLRARMDGRTRIVGSASRAVAVPGTVGLRLKLSKPARKQLRERGRLRLTLEVTHSKSDETVRQGVMLRD